MHAVIDRFEGDFAVVELPDGNMKDIKKSDIPLDAREGDVLILEGGRIRIDPEETRRRRAEMEKKVEDLWE